MLGQLGMGYRYAIEMLNEGRIGIGAQVRLDWCTYRLFFNIMTKIGIKIELQAYNNYHTSGLTGHKTFEYEIIQYKRVQ
jgi:hypothetical protein